jgi:hypothetical protein
MIQGFLPYATHYLSATSRLLKKSASSVLASLRPSTYPRGYASALLRCGLVAERRVLARWGWAGEKSGFLNNLLALEEQSVTCSRPVFPRIKNSLNAQLAMIVIDPVAVTSDE